jgi:5-methylcytosine-specific restriction endonuclease McrBC regulatory subunit McrC
LNISLVEYGDYEVWPLPSTLELEKSSNAWKEKLGLRQSPLQIVIRNNQKSIRAVGVTGFVSVNGVDIEIKPKFLASATNDRWRKMLWNILLFVESSSESLFGEHSIDETDEDSHFLDLLGWVFLNSMQLASLEGFPRGYVERRESTREIRGSIDYSQITAFLQNPFTFPCIYDEYSEDITVNRLLKWAGTLLSNQVKSSRLSNLLLDNLQHIKANGEVVPSIVEAEYITLPAQYNYVEPALKIAKMLLRNNSTFAHRF